MKLWRATSDPTGLSHLPSSLIATLENLESESIVLTLDEGIIYKSQGIEAIGIVKDNRINSEELMALIRVVRRSNEKQIGTIEIPRGPIGEGKRELRVTVAPITESDWVLVLVRDESEIERVAQVRRDFVANVSHELKTPIGALSLLSEAILGAKNDPQAVTQFASRMQSEALRLTDLVQEIIDLSKVQDSDPLQKAEEVRINEVIEDAINQCRTLADSRKIWVNSFDIHEVTVLGDREQLVMAIHNIVENAINYSPENTKVAITTKITADIVEISVADQGIGIAESELERIFERFYRVDPARSRQTGGTGLGLSIVKHVITKHGGEIKVWSAPNVGSTFVLKLPIFERERN